MSKNIFLDKFQSKTDKELQRIVEDLEKIYEFEVRQAAAEILKNRNIHSDEIKAIEKEELRYIKAIQNEEEKQKNSTQILIQNLLNIPIKTTIKSPLKDNKELEVWRISEKLFQTKIEHSRSMIAPVVICKIINNNSYLAFPFFNIKGFLTASILVIVVCAVFSAFGETKYNIDTILFSIPAILGFQILLTPIAYFMILNSLKKTYALKPH